MREWQTLVSILLEALGDEVALRGRPAWFFVANDARNPDPEAFRLGIGWEADAVIGGIAPPGWTAVGVVATGKALAPARGHKGARRAGGHRTGSVRIACLVTREEGTFAKAVTPDGLVIEEPPEGGLLLEDLQRCLGLAPGSSGPPKDAGALAGTAGE